MARLFISQDRIDVWTSQNKVHIEGDRMGLPTFGTTFRLVPAVLFLRVVSDGGDAPGLLGRVKTEQQLREMGAELVANSVLMGDVAYECSNGFVGQVLEKGSAGPHSEPGFRHSDIHRFETELGSEMPSDVSSTHPETRHPERAT